MVVVLSTSSESCHENFDKNDSLIIRAIRLAFIPVKLSVRRRKFEETILLET